MKNKEIILTIIIVILLLWILLNSSKEGMKNTQINEAFKKIGAKVKNTPNNRSVIITEITPGGSFDKAGLKIGNVILGKNLSDFVDYVNNNSSYTISVSDGDGSRSYHINS